MIRWPHLLCKPSMIPPCHLGIQKLHIHWRYPSGPGIYSYMAATSGTLRIDSEAIGAPFHCCLPWRHHMAMWITWLPLLRISHLQNSEIFIAPEQCIFHSNCEHRTGCCWWPWLSGIERTMVLFAILRAPHDATYCKEQNIFVFIKDLKGKSILRKQQVARQPSCWTSICLSVSIRLQWSVTRNKSPRPSPHYALKQVGNLINQYIWKILFCTVKSCYMAWPFHSKLRNKII